MDAIAVVMGVCFGACVVLIAWLAERQREMRRGLEEKMGVMLCEQADQKRRADQNEASIKSMALEAREMRERMSALLVSASMSKRG